MISQLSSLFCLIYLITTALAYPSYPLSPSDRPRSANPWDNCDGSSYCYGVSNMQQMCDGAMKKYDVNGNYTRATARTYQDCTVTYRCNDKSEYAAGISGQQIYDT